MHGEAPAGGLEESASERASALVGDQLYEDERNPDRYIESVAGPPVAAHAFTL